MKTRGTGPDVVLLHGFACSSDVWEKLPGTWEVWFESSVPPDPPGVDSCPPPDHPIIVDVDDQTGAASLRQLM